MSTRFDYDRLDIHKAYASVRALTRERREVWAKVLSRQLDGVDVRRIVDLGCGVGRFSPLLREVFRAAVAGVDRSERMLAAARAIPEAETISWIRASAEALPLAEGKVDLIFLFLVYHHLPDPLAALRECARVLTDNGAVFIVNSTVEILDSLRWLPFFPSARQIDVARLPTREEVTHTAQEVGLTLVQQGTVVDPIAPNLTAYAEHVASRTFSTLQLVSDEEFARGAKEFRENPTKARSCVSLRSTAHPRCHRGSVASESATTAIVAERSRRAGKSQYCMASESP